MVCYKNGITIFAKVPKMNYNQQVDISFYDFNVLRKSSLFLMHGEGIFAKKIILTIIVQVKISQIN
jgi:hypothetical protein